MWESSDSELEFVGNKNTTTGKSNSKKGKSKNGKKQKNKNIPKSPQPKQENLENDNKRQEQVERKNKLPLDLQSSPECSTDSSSEESEDGNGGMGYGKQALGIDPSELMNYDGTSAPQNGSQYLLSVIQETRKVPKVVVANPQDLASRMKPNARVSYLDGFKKQVDVADIAKTEQSNPYVPSQEWRNEKLNDFSLLRSKVERWKELLAKGVTKMRTDNLKLPEAGNRVVWQRFCLGIKFEKLVESRKLKAEDSVETIISDYFEDLKENSKDSLIKTEADGDESPLSPGSITTTSHVEGAVDDASEASDLSDVSKSASNNNGCPPLMSIMLLLSQKQVEQLIYYQSEWIDHYGFLNKTQGEWLYALLSCVEKPLEPSTMADIRNICKSLIKIKNNFCSKLNEGVDAGLNGTKHKEKEKLSCTDLNDLTIDSESDENPPPYSEYVNSLNLFIYLVGDYFSQKDLVMELT